MIIKFIGLSVIFLSVALLGINLSDEERKKRLGREEVICLLKEIEAGIKYAGRPVEATLEKFDSSLLLAHGFSKGDKKTEAYKNAIIEANLFDNRQINERLCNFFDSLGRSTSTQRELSLCRECIEFIENAAKSADSESIKKEYLFKRLGITVGILCVIILI